MSLKKLEKYYAVIRAEIMPVAEIEANPPQKQDMEDVKQDKMQTSNYMELLTTTRQTVVEDTDETGILTAAAIEAFVARKKAEQTEGEVSRVDDGW